MSATGAAGHDAGATTDEARLARILVWLILGLSAVRLVLAAVLGLSYDEALLAVKARHLRLSYFDHPPLASLLIAAVQWLTGSDSALVVRLPTIALFAGTTWLIFRIGAVLFSPLAGFCGAVALSLSPLFGFYFGTFAVTDAPMLFFIAAATLCLCHALFGDVRRATPWWLGAGLCAGLALLSKSYSAGLVMLGVAGFLITTPRHRLWFARPAPYLGAAVTLAVMTPVFIWNAQHEWISFSFPGGHPLAGAWTFQPVRLLTYWGVQALVMLPWIWLGLVAALVWGFGRGPQDERMWLLAWLAVMPIAIFSLVRLLLADRKGFHWVAPGFLLLFPLLGVMTERALAAHRTLVRHLLRVTVVTLVFVAVVPLSHLLTGWGQRVFPHLQQYDPIVTDMADWSAVREAIARHRGDSDMFVAGTRWEDCAKIEVTIRMPVVCLTRFTEIFAYLTDPRPLVGKDAIILARSDSEYMVKALASYFDRIEPLGTVAITHLGNRALVLNLYRGRTLRAIYPWPYGPYRAISALARVTTGGT